MNLEEPAILFLCSIVLFVYAYLSYKKKLSQRWRSGYFYAPKDEQKASGFKTKSNIQAFLSCLGGVAAIFWGCYFLFHEKWMMTVVMILGLFIIVVGFIIKDERTGNGLLNNKSYFINENDNNDFSITEIRINILRFPIIFGCYVLMPITGLVIILSLIYQIPKEFVEPESLFIFAVFSTVLGVGSWILNKLLPKMTLSYHDGVFKKERNGKIEFFSITEIKKVKMESPILPDYIIFYLKGKKKQVKVSFKGFKQDDRFEIPRKIISITKTKLTKTEKKILDDFSQK